MVCFPFCVDFYLILQAINKKQMNNVLVLWAGKYMDES